jgi:uncharacterized caspase-like protein
MTKISRSLLLLLVAGCSARAATLKDKESNCKQLVWKEGEHPTEVCATKFGQRKCAKTCAPWLQLAAAGEMVAHPRMALVIGNGRYKDLADIENAKNDAEAMTTKLKMLQFDVTDVYDADFETMQDAIDSFTKRLVPDVVAFFYYAGHGAAPGGKANYLLPVDINKEHIQEKPKKLRQAAFAVRDIVGDMEDKQTKVNILVLDACRDDPFGGGSRAVGAGGMAAISPPEGSVIIFAAKSGQTAGDGKGEDGHGLFTGSLLRHMESHAHEPLLRLVGKVRSDVYKQSGNKQRPEIIADLIDDAEDMMLDGNVAKTTASATGGAGGSGGGQQDDRVAKLEAELKEANAEKAQKSEIVKERNAEDVKSEKKQKEMAAASDTAKGRAKQAKAREKQNKVAAEKDEKEVVMYEQKEREQRQQEAAEAQLVEQRAVVARLESELDALVKAKKWAATEAKQTEIDTAKAKLAQAISCNADGTCASAGGHAAAAAEVAGSVADKAADLIGKGEAWENLKGSVPEKKAKAAKIVEDGTTVVAEKAAKTAEAAAAAAATTKAAAAAAAAATAAATTKAWEKLAGMF